MKLIYECVFSAGGKISIRMDNTNCQRIFWYNYSNKTHIFFWTSSIKLIKYYRYRSMIFQQYLYYWPILPKSRMHLLSKNKSRWAAKVTVAKWLRHEVLILEVLVWTLVSFFFSSFWHFLYIYFTVTVLLEYLNPISHLPCLYSIILQLIFCWFFNYQNAPLQ